MARRAIPLVSGLLAAACVVLTVVMVGNPLNLKHFGPIFGTLVAVSTVSVVVTALLLPVNLVVRVVIGGICGIGGAVLTALVAFTAIVFHSPGFAGTPVGSPDGRYALVVAQGRALVAIDPQYDVLLISGKGVLARESLVWRGVEDVAAPKSLRFVGPDEVELTTGDGCNYRSKFDRITLDVRPVWYESYQTDCARPR